MGLPGDLHAKGVGSNDLEGGEHDGRGDVFFGDLCRGVLECMAEVGKHVLDPEGDSVGGLAMAEEAGTVAG